MCVCACVMHIYALACDIIQLCSALIIGYVNEKVVQVLCKHEEENRSREDTMQQL